MNDDDLPDDDPDVIVGMERLRILRELESSIRDVSIERLYEPGTTPISD